MFRWIRMPSLAVILVVAGCAFSPTSSLRWHTQKASEDFVPGTRVLAQLVGMAPRQAVVEREGLFESWYDTLLSAGYSDTDLVDGSEVVVWTYCFGLNSQVSPCEHHGHYLAHVPPSLRDQFPAEGTDLGDGDLVEVALTETEDRLLFGEVTSVYRKAGHWAGCAESHLQIEYSISNAVTYGPPRGSWIECDDVEADGWHRNPVNGAPSWNGPPISEWIKLPAHLSN